MKALISESCCLQPDFSPIFVVGCMRSGTTLLSALLGRHTQIAATPETHFFFDVVPEDWQPRIIFSHKFLIERFLNSERGPDLNVDLERLAERFGKYPPTYAHLFRAILEEYAEAESKPLVVEKSPCHIFYAQLIFEWFPNAKVIHIVRDGRDCVLSLMAMPWAWIRRSIRWNSITWCKFVKAGMECEVNYPERVLRVHFEELLQCPERVLTKVSHFVGVNFEPSQLNPSMVTSVVPEWELAWKSKVQKQLDQSRINAWMNTMTPEQKWLMNSIMGRYLAKFNYPENSLMGCPLSKRLSMSTMNFVYLHLYYLRIHPFVNRMKQLLRLFGGYIDNIK